MKFKSKRLVSAVIASLITCTAYAHNTNYKNSLLCGQNKFDATLFYNGRRNTDKLNDQCESISTANKVWLGALGIAAVAAGAICIANRCGTRGEFVSECLKLDGTTQSEFKDIGKQDNNFSDVLINNSSDYMYEDVVCFSSSYLIDLAKRKFNDYNPQATKEDEYDYIEKFEHCYEAAVVLYRYAVTNCVESDHYTEALALISIVNDMLTIPDIDRIIRPGYQIAFYILSKFIGDYGDTLRWVDKVKKCGILNSLTFKHLSAAIDGRYLFDNNRRSELNLLRNMPLRVECCNDEIAIISEMDCGEKLEFVINRQNKKKIHYVFNSVEFLRSRNIQYEF